MTMLRAYTVVPLHALIAGCDPAPEDPDSGLRTGMWSSTGGAWSEGSSDGGPMTSGMGSMGGDSMGGDSTSGGSMGMGSSGAHSASEGSDSSDSTGGMQGGQGDHGGIPPVPDDDDNVTNICSLFPPNADDDLYATDENCELSDGNTTTYCHLHECADLPGAPIRSSTARSPATTSTSPFTSR